MLGFRVSFGAVPSSAQPPNLRRTWRIRGQVQGVGFRPFVYREAMELMLEGSVRNDPSGVTLVAQGPADFLDELIRRIREEAPALARVDDVTCIEEGAPEPDEGVFRIIASDHAPAERGRVTVDAAVCEDCLREMRDEGDRRFGHALINCTNCGPRYTIVRDLPYDRPLTTMAPFPMCTPCEAEYRDPGDRRFHAQPTCCPRCGPQLRFVAQEGEPAEGPDAIAQAATTLAGGGVIGVKGLGGYHLVCEAVDDDAVARLRAGKRRDHKPFAVMVANVEAAEQLVELSPAGRRRLQDPDRPIVLATRRHGTAVVEGVAPGNHRLGVMLPYTPIQHLLFDAGCPPLVMTSANESDDPLITDDDEVRRLAPFCDGFLFHDREIERAVDDGIVLDGPRGVVPIRRARGQVPLPLALPTPAEEPGLCVGGELKNTVALVRGDQAILGQHLGDLGYALAWRRFQRTIDDLERLFDIQPAWIACDAHPGYASQQWAQRRARELDVPLIEVQHHHAHLASLMAEHGRSEPTIGVICDGVGHGADGEAWGGEILVGDLRSCERHGRLRPLRLPGGDAAARETGRCALSWLVDRFGAAAADHPAAAAALADDGRRASVLTMLAAGLNCPPSSGMGRLFDAAAALLGLCDWNHHEALSGMRLESAAMASLARPSGADVVPVEPTEQGLLELDTRPLLDALLARGEEVTEAAWLFHDALADALARAVRKVRERTGIHAVAVSGGVFCNALLTEQLVGRLADDGCDVLVHAEVPPNDGGIAYGQAAVAAARLSGRAEI